ncbi:MAG: TonB-dependent receptor [Rhodospirillales bacterium]|nr:TonB-dependent receptor [Rhodospirillales bacterium]
MHRTTYFALAPALMLLMALPDTAQAADSGAITGHVLGALSKQPLAGAVVEIREAGLKATTGADGTYSFKDVTPGTYTLVATPPSGLPTQNRLVVEAGKTTQSDIMTRPAESAAESITVLGQRTPAGVARKAQEEAPNLINVQTYEEIRKLPDISTAEAVRRVPGISLETDEGEGRYVNIRGLDADLNSTTFGGLRLPPTNNASPFGGYRAVTLDSIPIGLVGAITVTKSNLPSQDAEALGGTIEITPKTAPPGGDFFVQGNIGSGYETLGRTPIADMAITTGGRFSGSGLDKNGPFSVVLTGTYYEDFRSINDAEPAYFADSAHPYSAINNLQQRDYELHRQRHGVGVDLGYQPDVNNSYYLRAFEAGYTEKYERQFLNLSPDGNTVAGPNGTLTDTLNGTLPNGATAIQRALRDEKETSTDRVVVLGGKNVFSGFTLDYRAGFTQGTYDKPYDYNSFFNFQPTPTNGVISYAPVGPGGLPRYTITGADYQNPANYQLVNFGNSTAHNVDEEMSFAGNIEHPVALIGADSEDLKFGLSARLRHKRTTAQPYSYPNLPNAPLTSFSSGSNETYYNGLYQNGVDIVPGRLQSVFGPGVIQAADVTSALQQYLDVHEDVYAGYGQYEVRFGALGLIGGLRIEGTRDLDKAFSAGVDANGAAFETPVTASNSYVNFFPSLQARYELQPDLIMRATYASTIARPGFNQSTASLSIDLGAGIVTRGNPNLKPATANNFDITIEKYLSGAGIISVGAFYKDISNYIVPVVSNQVLANANLFPGNTLPLRVFTFNNAGSSYARGIEFNWEQHFRDLPGLWSGLGAGLNYTFVDSSYQIRPGESSPLPSTSEHTWNASIFYDLYPVTIKLAAYSASADLFAIGPSRGNDTFNATRTSMDLGASYAVTDELVAYFNAKNLLDTPHTFYLGSPNRPIQREFYGQTFQTGLRFDF